MKTLSYAVVEEFFLLVLPEANPADDDWETCLEEFRRAQAAAGGRMRAIIYTDGGAPTLRQRGRLNELVGQYRTRIAVVSDANIVLRGIVTALSWFNPNIRAFSRAQESEAFVHVGADSPQQRQIREHAGRLREAVAGA